VRVLSCQFRDLFLKQLHAAFAADELRFPGRSQDRPIPPPSPLG